MAPKLSASVKHCKVLTYFLTLVRRTPVYMSPELINSRNGAKGYDGQSVDVWASGVLLIVMLLGTFPFDHIDNPDPNTSEAHLEVW